MANRYLDIQILTGSVITDPRYYKNAIYPEVPVSENDIYVITTSDDRLDLLAADYYGDTSLWWVISSANNLPGNSLYLQNGIQIRIPFDYTQALNQFIAINKLR
jgi:hypothetical protein